jgi:hypothetical protein
MISALLMPMIGACTVIAAPSTPVRVMTNSLYLKPFRLIRATFLMKCG